jgi:hydroxymethylpyrimidine/phosphomethylpyrimidine kinase
MPMARVLIIAGSDSGGGAGIQADIKTVTILGAYAASAVTALTAQNTQGVSGIFPIPPDFISQQINVVLSDIGADCIKTGMLHSAAVIEAVVESLKRYPSIALVVDPVMVAKGGEPLLESEAITALKEKLLPRAYLVTPNVPEAELLSGTLISNEDGMAAAGKRILQSTGCKAVLVKGGHLKGERVCDLLVTEAGETPFYSSRIDSYHTHGTGCTLASAIATGLARGASLSQAIEKARHYVHEAIVTAPGLGHGHGPLNHGWPLQKS